MIRLIKDPVQSILKTFNYRVVYSPRHQITGINFADDVKLLVRSERPVCFDVGANEGQTIELLRGIFNNPRIYAFEPSSQAFRKLLSQGHGPQVSLHNFALGQRNGEEEFINYENSCLSSFLPLDANKDNPFRALKVKNKEAVDVRTIDWFARENQINKIDLLKIDTQGYDLQVLKGAGDSFQNGLIDNVFIELNFVKMYEDQSGPNQITDFLAERNIHLVDYYEKERQNHRLAWCTALYSKH